MALRFKDTKELQEWLASRSVKESTSQSKQSGVKQSQAIGSQQASFKAVASKADSEGDSVGTAIIVLVIIVMTVILCLF
jgi:hypothetical protein